MVGKKTFNCITVLFRCNSNMQQKFISTCFIFKIFVIKDSINNKLYLLKKLLF